MERVSVALFHLVLELANQLSIEQLQKMGILADPKAQPQSAPTSSKKAKQLDASSLKPLKSTQGTVGFTGYRDTNAKPSSFGNGKSKDDDEMDSDEDDFQKRALNGTQKDDKDGEEEDGRETALSAEELSKRGELAEGVKKMQLKRQHSFEKVEPSTASVSVADSNSQPGVSPGGAGHVTPPSTSNLDSVPSLAKPAAVSKLAESEGAAGSPYKKQRASIGDERDQPLSTSTPFAAGLDTNFSDSAPRTDGTDTSFSNKNPFTPTESRPTTNVTSDTNNPNSMQGKDKVDEEL